MLVLILKTCVYILYTIMIQVAYSVYHFVCNNNYLKRFFFCKTCIYLLSIVLFTCYVIFNLWNGFTLRLYSFEWWAFLHKSLHTNRIFSQFFLLWNHARSLPSFPHGTYSLREYAVFVIYPYVTYYLPMSLRKLK